MATPLTTEAQQIPEPQSESKISMSSEKKPQDLQISPKKLDVASENSSEKIEIKEEQVSETSEEKTENSLESQEEHGLETSEEKTENSLEIQEEQRSETSEEKSENSQEIQEEQRSETEDTTDDNLSEKLGTSPPKLIKKGHPVKRIRNNQVPTIGDIERQGTDLTEQKLIFITRAHEFLRWSIGCMIFLVPVKYLIEAQEEEKETPKPSDFPLQLFLSILEFSFTKLLLGFNVYFAYPFCASLAAYGTFHLSAARVSSPTRAILLEQFSLGSGLFALAIVVHFAGPWVLVTAVISVVVVVGIIVGITKWLPC